MNWLSFGATEQWTRLLRCACLVLCPLPYLMPEAPFCGYVLVGLRMRDIAPLLFCLCKKIARMSCSAYERGSSTLSFMRNVERSIPPPSFACFEQRMTVPNFWRSAVVWSVACAERRATKAYAERLRIVAGRNAIEYGFDSQEFGGCLESCFNQNL